MTSENTKLLEGYYAAWSQHDPEAVLAFFTESSVFEDLAFAARFEGLEQIRGFIDLTYAGVPDFRVVPNTILCDRSQLAAEWIMSGTHSGDMPGLPATGQTFEIRAASVVRLEKDKIVSIVDYWNLASFQRCVGLA